MVWSSDTTCKTVNFTWDTSQYHGFFWNKLPPIYQQQDLNTRQVALEVTSDADFDGEYRNIGEDGTVKRGELERFLRIFETLYARVMGGVAFYDALIDVDDTLPDFLALIADLVGVTFNRDISIQRARAEVRNAVPIYKIKGTLESLEIIGRSVTSLANVVADEVVKHILVSNRVDRLSAQPSNPEIVQIFNLPNDPTGFSMELYNESTQEEAPMYSPDMLRIFLYITTGVSLSTATLAKLYRKLDDIAPATTRQKLVLLDALNYESSVVIDEWEDVIT